LCNHETDLHIHEHFTDTHGYTVTWTHLSRRPAPGGRQGR
jgi:hypothetical protein